MYMFSKFRKIKMAKTFHKAVKVFGARNQEDIAIEEMSELTKALIKHRRYNTECTKEDILEEMVDVYIMLCQLCIIHGFDEEKVYEKVERLSMLLESEGLNDD